MCGGFAGVDWFGVLEDDGIEGVGGGSEETGAAEIGFLFLFWWVVFLGDDIAGSPGARVAFEADLLVG